MADGSRSRVLDIKLKKKEEEKVKTRLLGSPEAFAEVYNMYQPKIYAYIATRVNSVEDAEDLTSRTFEKTLRNLESYDPERSSVATWIYRIAHNVIVDYYRKETSRKSVDQESLKRIYQSDRTTEEDALRLEVLTVLMRDLPDSYQEVLTLKFLEGLSNREVAEILGCTSEALSTRTYRALKELKNRLDRAREKQPELWDVIG